MSLPQNSRNNSRSINRGPTMRGRDYRPPIGRTPHTVDEQPLSFNTLQHQDHIEIQHVEYGDQTRTTTERLHPHPYQHGNETFGDIISHPIDQFKEHCYRKQHHAEESEKWEHKATDSVIGSAIQQDDEKQDFIIVVHFRQLRGNQDFVLDHGKVEEFAAKIGMTPQERIQFNGVRDTDGLTAFLYRNKREFSIKIHHKAGPNDHSAHHAQFDHAHSLENNQKNHVIEFSENVFVEFKPRHYKHFSKAQPESTRRPFFRYPDPDLSADIGAEKAASWLELFYDLFYVATLTEFTHTHHFMDFNALGLYTQWFIVTWWAWCASSLYTARFDTDDVVHHIYKLIEMCAVIGMVGSSDYFLNSRRYVYGYIVLKAVLVIEYSVVFIVALLARSKSRIALSFYVGANLVSIALWSLSTVVHDSKTHRALWYLGILTEVFVNIIVRRDQSLSWAASNLAERLGLLTLIVFGENLMGLVRSFDGGEANASTVIPNYMAVVIIFGFYFMYFEDFNKEVFLHANYHQTWVYLHFPLHLCQVAFGISLVDSIRIYKEQSQHVEFEHHRTTNTSSDMPTGAVEATEAAHKLAKRAIASVTSQEKYTFNPMTFDTPTAVVFDVNIPPVSQQGGILTLGKTLLGSILTMVFSQLATDTENHLLIERPSSSVHHLTRRSLADGESSTATTVDQRTFVYKTFLICSGLLLVINSFLKMINTRIADVYGKIIIGSRIINAVFLWCMCAIPFARLDAIILLSVLMCSLILQAMIDLLD